MSKAKNLFAKTLSREKGGSIGSSGYDFQKDWGICEIIRRHELDEEYIAFFDHHEDLVFGNDEKNPQSFDFFQVKTLSKPNWTIGRLLKIPNAKSGGKNSIVGKLFFNKVKFKKYVKGLHFVSNAHLNVIMKDGRHAKDVAQYPCKSLKPSEAKKIATSIKVEHKLKSLPKLNTLLYFHKSDLSVDDSKGHAKGRLAEFISRYIPSANINPIAVYNALFDEVRKKTNQVTNATTFSELAGLKSIARSFVVRMLNQIARIQDPNMVWTTIEVELIKAGIAQIDILAISLSWRTIEVKQMGHDNLILEHLRNEIDGFILKLSDNVYNKLTLDKVVSHVRKNDSFNLFTDVEIQAIYLRTSYENGKHSEACKKST